MPQMGESIAEGTIVRWMKKVGDAVERDEPLFEITTDKVDAEIPAPAAGVLTDIKVQEGETVAVNTIVATIGQPGEPTSADNSMSATAGQVAAADSSTAPTAGQPSGGSRSVAARAEAAPRAEPVQPAKRSSQAKDVESVQAAANAAAASTQPQADGQPQSIDELRRRKSSPLVRRIARDNNVDIMQIPGSGIGGRVTKHDILEYLNEDVRRPAQFPRAVPPAVGPSAGAPPAEPHLPVPSDRVDIQPLSPMRKKIAEHMLLSRRTSAHVHSVFHVDFSHVERIRREKKDEYARLGARLTYLAFIAKAVIDAIRRHPIINASLDGDNVLYKKDVNLGIAVALESGLIVPVVKNADEKNLLGLSRAIADVADRARAKQLKPDEVHGGTFTITNPGQFGAQFGMPIINQPQVAILGVGTIERRPVVIDDAIAIRTMAYLTLGFDHRLIDGAVADQFMADVKQQLEQFDASHV
jgi:pyruvate dehydrogenase E2 component (dihydrolipoyllysine-residue acetyltransferase)